VAAGIAFISGGLTVVLVAAESPIGDLLERITIGAFLQWMLVIAWTT
jgi:hypothetical protein